MGLELKFALILMFLNILMSANNYKVARRNKKLSRLNSLMAASNLKMATIIFEQIASKLEERISGTRK